MEYRNIIQKDLAEMLDTSVQSLNKWEKEPVPLPFHGEGRTKRYSVAEVLAWRDARRCRKCTLRRPANASADDSPADLDLKQEQAALAKVKRQREEIELAHDRRELVSATEMERLWSGLMNKFRTQMLSLRARIAAKHGSEVAADVDVETRRALTILSKGLKPEDIPEEDQG